ncbi:MAG TPA: hypothetical protein VGN48_01285 [Pedococcus sp.]|jgi:hypothetical protein|nr:hypothetical protein [Pedococcus sp.]
MLLAVSPSSSWSPGIEQQQIRERPVQVDGAQFVREQISAGEGAPHTGSGLRYEGEAHDGYAVVPHSGQESPPGRA